MRGVCRGLPFLGLVLIVYRRNQQIGMHRRARSGHILSPGGPVSPFTGPTLPGYGCRRGALKNEF